MAYFVTGATGFIGRFLVANLLKRGEPVYVLVRKTSAKKLAALREYWGADEKQVIGVIGDLGKKNLGVADADLKKLKGKIKHFFHLAAIYDLAASAEDQQVANVEGTRHAVQFAEAVQAGCFHQVSSIAAAGLYDGVFREDMFEEAEELDHPYFRTKHDSEGIVRRECKRPWRIYRPSAVVGHSKTGFIDKIDGPYYFFKTLQKMRNILPPWMPLIGIEGGRLNVVPVDFVADAIDHIAHKRGLDGQVLPSDRPRAGPHRRGPQHLRPGRPRAADDDAPQRARVRLHPGAAARGPGLALTGEADGQGGADRSSASRATCSGSSTGRRATTIARRPRRSRVRALPCRSSRPTPRRCGTTGSATSTPISSSTTRSPAASRTRSWW